MMCPYYDMNYKCCNISGVYQKDREYSCLSDYDWRKCVNYTNSSLDVKLSKRLRPNPDL